MQTSNMREIFRKVLRELFFDNTCTLCYKTLDREAFLCKKCLKELKSEAYLKNSGNFFYIFYYNEKIRQLIADYKLRNRKDLARDIAYLIGKALKDLIKEEKIDIIIPVPINKERLKERGFNQVEYILDLLKIKYMSIERTKNTKHMYSMEDYEKRRKNVEKAFLSKLDLSNKRVLLIDDIVTSGATVKAIIKEIEKANKNVEIKIFSIAIARKFVLA